MKTKMIHCWTGFLRSHMTFFVVTISGEQNRPIVHRWCEWDFHIWIQYIQTTDNAEVAYIPDLLAKEHNFFCEAGCKQGESQLYECTFIPTRDSQPLLDAAKHLGCICFCISSSFETYWHTCSCRCWLVSTKNPTTDWWIFLEQLFEVRWYILFALVTKL